MGLKPNEMPSVFQLGKNPSHLTIDILGIA